MKKTIQSRITTVLITSIFFITLIGGLSLYYISQISSDIELVIKKDIMVEREIGLVKSELINLQRLQRIYLDSLRNQEELISLAPSFGNIRKSFEQILPLIESSLVKEKMNEMELILNEYELFLNGVGHAIQDYSFKQMRSDRDRLNKFNERIKSIINEILEIRYQRIDEHQKGIEILIDNALRNMLLFLLISVAGGAVLIIIAPKQVTAPFKRFVSAIEEFKELKFDTRLPVSGGDEVSNLGRVINKLLDRLNTFDEIKRKRIQFEKNKQRVLCNMLDQGVLIISIEGEILFMNAQLAKVLNINAESYQSKDYVQADIPDEMKEIIHQFLKSKEKTDNLMFILNYFDPKSEMKQMVEVLVDVGLVRNYKGEIVNVIFTFEDITHIKGESLFKRISIS